MKIKNWENHVYKKYGAEKIENFSDLKNYLTSPKNYAHNFTPGEITEGYIENDEFYSAYVFDEYKIANRSFMTYRNTCWTTTIVFLASKDTVNISNYFIHTAGGLTEEELSKFYNDINPMK